MAFDIMRQACKAQKMRLLPIVKSGPADPKILTVATREVGVLRLWVRHIFLTQRGKQRVFWPKASDHLQARRVQRLSGYEDPSSLNWNKISLVG